MSAIYLFEKGGSVIFHAFPEGGVELKPYFAHVRSVKRRARVQCWRVLRVFVKLHMWWVCVLPRMQSTTPWSVKQPAGC